MINTIGSKLILIPKLSQGASWRQLYDQRTRMKAHYNFLPPGYYVIVSRNQTKLYVGVCVSEQTLEYIYDL